MNGDVLTLGATLLGAFVGGVIGFVGAYLVQKQRFSRENVIEMRDKIYGPIFMDISRILENVRLFQNPNSSSEENLKEIMDDYLFFTTKQDLKSKLSRLMDRLDKYQRVRYAAEEKFGDIAREIVKTTFKVDIGSDVSQISLRILIGKVMASGITLKEVVFRELSPKDFAGEEKKKWGNDIQIDVRNLSEKGNSLDGFESLYTLVLRKSRKESLYMEEKKQRILLIQELENFLEQIKPYVNL